MEKYCICLVNAGVLLTSSISHLNCKGYANFGIVHKFVLCTEYHKCL